MRGSMTPNSKFSRMLKKGAGERPGALLVRGTEEGMRPDDLSCSRNARPENDLREQADRSSCSQNAHDKNVLVRCAQ